MQSDFGSNLIASLLNEIGNGVGCRHRFEPEFGISADLLAGAGLIKAINSRIPACNEHGCPLLGSCSVEKEFDKGSKANRGNRKFRLTDTGRQAIDDPGEMLVALTGSPAARAIFTTLESGSTSIFRLARDLLQADAGAARDEVPEPGYGRRDLGNCLSMLESLGLLAIEPDGTVRRLDALS